MPPPPKLNVGIVALGVPKEGVGALWVPNVGVATFGVPRVELGVPNVGVLLKVLLVFWAPNDGVEPPNVVGVLKEAGALLPNLVVLLLLFPPKLNAGFLLLLLLSILSLFTAPNINADVLLLLLVLSVNTEVPEPKLKPVLEGVVVEDPKLLLPPFPPKLNVGCDVFPVVLALAFPPKLNTVFGAFPKVDPKIKQLVIL